MNKSKPTKYDWSKVDWSKPDGQIARQLNCPAATVFCARKRANATRVKAYPPWHENVDWTQSNEQIARQFNKTETQVRGARNRHANGIRAKTRKPRKRNTERYIGRLQAFNDWRLGLINEQPSTAAQITLDLKRAISALSERKTVHEWLNQLGTPTREETGKPMCLLRRLAVALKIAPHSTQHEPAA